MEISLKEALKLETRLPLEHVPLNTRLLFDIQVNGIKEPIEVRVRADGSKVVWDGLHRLKVAATLGLETVPVIYTRPNKDDGLCGAMSLCDFHKSKLEEQRKDITYREIR